MPIPILVIAGTAALGAAIALAVEELADKGFPTTVTVTNRTSETLTLIQRMNPPPEDVWGQTPNGASSQFQQLPDSVGPGEGLVCSCYASGADGVAGALFYRLGSGNHHGFVLAWFAGGGVKPHYAVLERQYEFSYDLWSTDGRATRSLATKSYRGPFHVAEKALSDNWKTGRNQYQFESDPITITADINQDVNAIDVRFTVDDIAAAPARESGPAAALHEQPAEHAGAQWKPTLTSSDVNGRNVAKVVAGASAGAPTAVFRQTGPSTWTEFDASGTTERFAFAEVNRDDWSVYLIDASRDIEVQLDLHRKMVTFRIGTGARKDLYPIAGSQAIAR